MVKVLICFFFFYFFVCFQWGQGGGGWLEFDFALFCLEPWDPTSLYGKR